MTFLLPSLLEGNMGGDGRDRGFAVTRRMLFEGQEVAAALDIKVIGNKFVSIDPSSMLQDPKNCAVPSGTLGVIDRIEDAKVLVRFFPGKTDMRALWFEKVVVATQLRLFDKVHGGP